MTIDHRIGLLVLAWVLYANGVAGMLHCLSAHQLCLKDEKCAALLDIITTTCGDNTYDGTVCRAINLDTCRGALNSVWYNPVFGGSCFCGDSITEGECHHVKNTLSDHPCLRIPPFDATVLRINGVDNYPTCTYGLQICKGNPECNKFYEYFRKMCRIKDGACAMHNWVKCERAWNNLQLTPIYGCLCHEEEELDKCAKLYRIINRNPCVDKLNDKMASYWSSTDSSQSESSEVTWFHTDDPVDGYGTIGYATSRDESSTFPIPSAMNYSENKFISAIFGQQVHFPNTVITMPNGISYWDLGDPARNEEAARIIARSTCQRAYRRCEEDKTCWVLLGNMLQACDTDGVLCNRTECMASVVSFFMLGNPSITKTVAFCICKPNDNECLTHQRRLHPPCSQRHEVEPPQCLDVNKQCQIDHKCRPRMKTFVEACAVNPNTLQCQGSLENCRSALVGILGTKLRTSCGCAGNDIGVVYRCIDVQRMVWLNPCVVQAQKDYLENRTNIPTPPPLPLTPTTFRRFTIPRRSTTSTTTTTNFPSPTPWLVTDNPITLPNDIMTTTDNNKYCIAKSYVNSEGVKIPVNEKLRIYEHGKPHCSMICSCSPGDPLNLSCHQLGCVEMLPCNSSVAVYDHASPGYTATQGHCLCYSGKFICIKPSQGSYELTPGVYLFLGYSKIDEELLRKNMSVSITDAVRFIQRMVDNHWPSNCRLTQSQQIGENLILQAYLEDFAEQRQNNSVTADMVDKEEETCGTVLRNISLMIENKDPLVVQNVALSIIKIAGVEKYSKGYAASSGNTTIAERQLMMFSLVLFLLSVWRRGIGPFEPPT